MAPEQAEEAAAATAPGLTGLFDDAYPGCEVSDRRAPLGPPPEQQERVQQAAIEAGRSEASPSSIVLSESGRKKSYDVWDNDEEVDSNTGEALPSSPEPAQDGELSDQDPVLVDEEMVIRAEMIPPLFEKMFVVTTSQPAASGVQQTSPAATNRLVKLVSLRLR